MVRREGEGGRAARQSGNDTDTDNENRRRRERRAREPRRERGGGGGEVDERRRRRRESREVEKSGDERAAHRERDRERDRHRSTNRHTRHTRHHHHHHQHSSSDATSHLLSEDSLAKLNKEHDREVVYHHDEKGNVRKASGAAPREKTQHQQQDKRKRRVVSGPLLEEGRGRKREEERIRGGGAGREESPDTDAAFRKRRKRLWIIIIAVILFLVILIPVAVVVSRKNSSKSKDESSGGNTSDKKNSSPPSNTNLKSISSDTIPITAKGSILDPFTWYDTTDFNVTFTDAKVGDLPLMGLNSSWDDNVRAHANVPPLNSPFDYGKRPIRGVNLGGWLSIEPFITPSFFREYDSKMGIIDEYTLTKHLGPSESMKRLERHYATFVTEETFIEIAKAGLDHVRIPFSYWAVTTYGSDPYVSQISWRYLLRGIEWARKHGLRIKLDLHGAPGSQNGWNHSGRLGLMGWLNGTEGPENGKRSLEIHDRLSTFFAQPRYENVIAMYGLLNEPKMNRIPTDIVMRWNTEAISLVRKNGIMKAKIVLSDGFLGMGKWKGQLSGTDPHLVLDVHQYIVFSNEQLGFSHKKKVEFVCDVWGSQFGESSDRNTGFGPTICGEWSQSDTDCTPYINNVGIGSRWTGNFNNGDPSIPVALSPVCPTAPKCDCGPANSGVESYSASYKKFLLTFAMAQMDAFEKGWGWFYWTWDTEMAVQWSYRKAWKAGIMPPDASRREAVCGSDIPDFEDLPESY
ncbi:MAG: Serine/threonine-protein phosphatase 2A activator 1 [Watsoniomyces obsoletus]|nr:MAG: Serine/threonine-protein phosphatase 2A activator 1 [Watsoniomyces obsoletus]